MKMDWPTYIKNTHSDWLVANSLDVIKQSVAGSLNSAFDSYQFNGFLDYEEVELSESLSNTLSKLVNPDLVLTTLLKNFQDDIEPVKNHLELLKENEVMKIAQLKSEFRSLNMVQSSNYVIAESVIRSMTLRMISDFALQQKTLSLHRAWVTSVTGLALKRNMPTLLTEVTREHLSMKFTLTKFFHERLAYQTLFNLRALATPLKVMAAIKGSVVPTSETLKILQGQRDRMEAQTIANYVGAVGVAYIVAEAGYAAYMSLSGAESALMISGGGSVGLLTAAVTIAAITSYYTYDLIQQRGNRPEDWATLGIPVAWEHEWNDAGGDWSGILRKTILVTMPLSAPLMHAFRNFLGLG